MIIKVSMKERLAIEKLIGTTADPSILKFNKDNELILNETKLVNLILNMEANIVSKGRGKPSLSIFEKMVVGKIRENFGTIIFVLDELQK